MKPVPVSFREGDLERCDAALRRFETSYGGGHDAPIRSALLGIAQAGGWRGDEWALEEYSAGRDVDTQAWRWLALMADAAGTADPALAGRVGFFFRVFSCDIGPNLRMADYFDFGLGQPPEPVYRAALVSAIKSLDRLTPDAVVLQYPKGQFDARGMIFLLGASLAELPEVRDPDETAARAIAASVSRGAHEDQQRVTVTAPDDDETLDLRLRAVQAARRRASAEPDRADYRRVLAGAYDALGDAQRTMGKRDEALDSYTRRLQITQRLAAGEPERLDYQRKLSAAYDEFGDAQRTLGNHDAAFDSYMASLHIVQRLASEDPERLDYQRKLAAAHRRLGDISADEGDAAAADRHFSAALRTARRLLALQPESANAAVDLADALSRTASLRDDPRGQAEAVALLEQLEAQGRLNKRGAATLAQMR